MPGATPAERRLAAIWRRQLGIREVKATDNFFDLGGHSLLVTLAVAEIKNEFGVHLHPGRFAVETLAQLAASLQAALDGTVDGSMTFGTVDSPGGSPDDGPTDDLDTRVGRREASPAPAAEHQPPAPGSTSFMSRLRRRLAGT